VRSAVILVAALVLAGCGGDGGERSGSATSAPGGGVQELENVLDLRSAFEADAGKTRAILLLSPT
jgi:ABC-type glycerol-3-phosphate transport system substrate-binding protein